MSDKFQGFVEIKSKLSNPTNINTDTSTRYRRNQSQQQAVRAASAASFRLLDRCEPNDSRYAETETERQHSCYQMKVWFESPNHMHWIATHLTSTRHNVGHKTEEVE